MPVVGEIFKLTISAQGPNGLNQNTHYYEYAGSLGSGDSNARAAELGQAYLDTALAGYVPMVTTNVVFDSIVVRGVTAPLAGAELSFTQSGGATGDDLPYQISPYIKWKTNFIGRSYQGRTRFFPTTEAFATGSTVAGTYITAANVYRNLLLPLKDSGAATVGFLLVYSTKLAQGEYTSAGLVQSFVSTQRRRAPGVGA